MGGAHGRGRLGGLFLDQTPSLHRLTPDRLLPLCINVCEHVGRGHSRAVAGGGRPQVANLTAALCPTPPTLNLPLFIPLGCGISKSQLRELFSPPSGNADTNISRNQRLGLGLFLGYHLARYPSSQTVRGPSSRPGL